MTTTADTTLLHKSILASAGAGKTYQLTKRYLQLMVAGAEPETILASTFTRAAAGEIRDRILERLAKASLDPGERAKLADDLEQPKLSEEDVLELLVRVARNLHRLQVRTLDSFFFSIVQSFALELGITPGATTVEEDVEARLRREAIRAVLDDAPDEAIVNLLRSLTQGGSDKAINRTIETVVKDLYDFYLQSGAAAWAKLNPPAPLPADALAAAVDALAAYPLPSQKGFSNAIINDVAQARTERWGDFISNGVAVKLINGSGVFGKTPIDPALVDLYTPILVHARAILLGRVARQTVATRELLDLYHDRYRRLKERHHAITFSDVTNACADAASSEAIDEICWRLDARIQHLLLDEMQDTSIKQWAALRPFAEEMVSHRPPERSFFCVGDVKQSIYGWRGAVPEILQKMPTLLGGAAVTVDTLKKSYRSAPAIMNVVNEVFGDVASNTVLQQWPEVVTQWREMFSDHETEHDDMPGRVELRTAPRAVDGEKQPLVRFREAARLIREHHLAAPGATIGVLTRKNDTVARIIFELAELGVVASERGGMPLTNSPAVTAALDLLRLADHPDDTIAAFHVASGPLGPAVELTVGATDHQRRAVAARVRRRLLDGGYASTITEWIEAVAPSCSERELGRLFQLAEEAGRYDARRSLRPDDFVSLIEEKKIADRTPSRIQVMTVHQSKGLEFDFVVLPELNAKLGGGTTPTVVYRRDRPDGDYETILRYMNDDILQLAPELQPIFTASTDRIVRESLCVLYVAMTRARRGLLMLIDPPTVKKDGTASLLGTFEGTLRAALEPDVIEPSTCLYATGDAAWPIDAETPETAPVPAPVRPVLREPISPTISVSGPSPSIATHAGGATLDELLQPRDDLAIDRGVAIHALFEQVEWIEAFTPEPDRLLATVRRAAPRRPEPWAARQVEDFLAMIESPEIAGALRRRDGCIVHRERPYARIVQGALQRGTIDRLVVESAAGTPVRATIIDFKTDDVTADAAASRVERYRVQLDAYRAAMSEQLGLEPDRIDRVLLFCTPGTAVPLG